MKGLARDEEEFFAAREWWRAANERRRAKPRPVFEPLPLPKIERERLLDVIA